MIALGVAALLSVSLPHTAMGHGPSLAKRTPARARHSADRRPNLEGIWEFLTITPLERPKDLADKAFFTPEEAAEWARKTLERVSFDNRDGGASRNLSRGYNEYWVERGLIVKTLRTSLIIDPPDGKLPAKSEEGRQRSAASAAQERAHLMTARRTIGCPIAV
jgi:hypothetical protein